jgi:hypothetical protein
VSSTATATFNEAVQASTINFTLTPQGGGPVAATVTYNSSNYTATLTPSAALAYSTTYTATVSGTLLTILLTGISCPNLPSAPHW